MQLGVEVLRQNILVGSRHSPVMFLVERGE